MTPGSDTKAKIMEATYEALCEHGYATLSIEKIASRLDMEKSAIYYHFDDKDDLLSSFLTFMEKKIRQQVPLDDAEPEERLDHFLAMALGTGNRDKWEFRKALFEMQSEGPHNPAFADAFRDIHELMQNTLTQILNDLGVDRSTEQAEYMFYCIEGIMASKIGENDASDLERLHSRIKNYFTEEGA
ncbi:MAG: TetR/AcrR family transcriptional regulator [Candidatus Nanohaloarchaea archaeon]|nr:TetR/AcrR family transcriptional regulator [Candidatus Nanohaloarchaea archaeon]